MSCLSSDGMFCNTCLKWGSTPAGTQRTWTTRGMTDWNHATELFKQHADSKWQKETTATSAMASQRECSQPELELQCSVAAQEATELRQRN